MDPQVLNHAQQVAADVMSNVSSEQLDLPTPCDNWNVGQLIDHLVGAQHWAASGIRGSEMRDAAGASQGDFNGAFQAGEGINPELQDGSAFKVSPRVGFVYDFTGDYMVLPTLASGASSVGMMSRTP